MLSDRRFTIYRTTHLSPRQGTLLGLIWIVVQRNRELGRGAFVSRGLLMDLISAAQNRRLIDPSVRFERDRARPYPYSVVPRADLEELVRQGFLHTQEMEGTETFSFLGTAFFELTTNPFRHIRVFGFVELVNNLADPDEDRVLDSMRGWDPTPE